MAGRYARHCCRDFFALTSAKGGRLMFGKIIRGIAILILSIVAFAFFFGEHKPTSQSLYDTPKLPPLDPAKLVTVTKFSWEKSGFGSVGIGNFTLRNDNDFEVKDITVRCEFVGNSGTVLSSSNSTIYDTVASLKSRTFNKMNLGFIHSQSSAASCSVLSVRRN
jgi:hypothetical protein